jgi:hypothetical protein
MLTLLGKFNDDILDIKGDMTLLLSKIKVCLKNIVRKLAYWAILYLWQLADIMQK